MKKKAGFGASCKERKYRIAKFAGMSSKVNWSALQNTSLTVNYQSAIEAVLEDSNTCNEVMQAMLFGKDRHQFAAARIISLASDVNPKPMQPFLQGMLDSLVEKRSSEQAMRTILRIFNKLPIPPELESTLTDVCIEFMHDRTLAIACRAYAINLLTKITAIHPELANELVPFINQLAVQERGALGASARTFIKKINQNKKIKVVI